MTYSEIYQLYGFYQNELKSNILGFWLPQCVDREYGGYVNCFDNRGENLVSYDKYTWSQGRFLWCFARLACLEAPVFSDKEKKEFLELAAHGADFLMKHCLMGPDDWRVSFLMERDGTHKEVAPGEPLDMSIYADCFVVGGLGMYAFASGKKEPYEFAKKLFESILERLRKNDFRTLPYPLSKQYRAHGIPMILDNLARELYRAAEILDPEYAPRLKKIMEACVDDILTHFVDENNVLHEIITVENAFFPQVLGQHANPGHTIEDAWFMLDAVDICCRPEWEEQICATVKRSLEIGWDQEFGGLLHFSGTEGGKPEGDTVGVEEEPMYKQLSGWGDKLWWVHSETLYTTLLCYFREGDAAFLDWHNKVFDYTFRTFPNTDPNVREWIQIQTREGKPQDKVVALPVKDPYHILRNMLLIVELLYRECEKAK